MNLLMDGIGAAFNIIGFLLNAVQSPVGFNAIDTDGYAVASNSMQISSGPLFNRMGNAANRGFNLSGGNTINNNLDITTTAAVLSDAWSAGGTDHVYRQAGGTVPTTALNSVLNAIPGFNTMWSIAAALAPELMPCPNPDDPLSLYYNPSTITRMAVSGSVILTLMQYIPID